MEIFVYLMAVIGGILMMIGLIFEKDLLFRIGIATMISIFWIILLIPPCFESKASSKEPIINVDSIYKAGYYKGLIEADSVLKKCECSDGTIFLLKK